MPIELTEGENTYIELDEAEEFFLSHAAVNWANTVSNDEKKAALVMATQYLDSLYDFKGYIKDSTGAQLLSWPRSCVYDRNRVLLPSDAIPQKIKDATCYLADQHIAESLFVTEDQQGIARQKAGSVEIEYFAWANTRKRFYFVESMISDFVRGSSVTSKLTRV